MDKINDFMTLNASKISFSSRKGWRLNKNWRKEDCDEEEIGTGLEGCCVSLKELDFTFIIIKNIWILKYN